MLTGYGSATWARRTFAGMVLLFVSPNVLATIGSDALIRTLEPIPHRRKPQLRPKQSSRCGRADFSRPALHSALRLAVVPDLASIYRLSISDAPELRRPRRRSTAALTFSSSGSSATNSSVRMPGPQRLCSGNFPSGGPAAKALRALPTPVRSAVSSVKGAR